jgi:hypothetical protein
MTVPRDQTIAASLLQNWSIREIRYALLVQLRLRSEKANAFALIAALLELSNISGRVEMIRTLMRDAVRRRCKKSRTVDHPSVTMVDAQRSCDWLRAQLNGTNDLSHISAHIGNDDLQAPSNRPAPRNPARKRNRRTAAAARNKRPPRRIIRLASREQTPNDDIRTVIERSKADRRVQFVNSKTRTKDEPVQSNEAIPETLARLPPTSNDARPLQSSSFPVYKDESDRQIDGLEEAAPLPTGETMTSSPPVLQPEPPRCLDLKRAN